MKKILIALLLIPAFVQSQARNEFWIKVSAKHHFKNRWTAEVDFLHRRQANFYSGEKNMFHLKLLNSIRPWAYYQLKKNWQLVLSPASFFIFDDIKNSNGDLKKKKEIRVAAGISKSYSLGKIRNKNRFIAEERFINFNNDQSYKQLRFRFLTSFSYPFSKKSNQGLSYQIADELIIKSLNNDIGFDQNRLYNSIHWKLKQTDIELGYQLTHVQGDNSSTHNNQLIVALNFTI